ncbi:hypothetical protein DRO32_03450 [Candidatus Bathyarchaeota archaeon]|nr:MAG: hypothetical protein DRO32_03450 [Candidatus Bathyarchaeota archaeon]
MPRGIGAPSLEGLLKFLEALEELGTATLYRVAKETGLTYATAHRYMRFCMEKGLLVSLGRGPRGGMKLSLSEEGRKVLEGLRALRDERGRG